MSATYQIRDEPIGQQGFRFVVEPFWELLAVMLAGAWLGAALFAVNAWFLRGPTWQRETALCVALPLGAGVLYALVSWVSGAGYLPPVGVKYAMLSLVLWKISVAYAVFFLQQTSFSLYQYFGGKVHNGVLVVFVGYFFGKRLLLLATDNPLVHAMVS